MVWTYSVDKSGPGLSRESQEIVHPRDYGVYTIGKDTFLCTTTIHLSTQETPHFILFPTNPAIFDYGGNGSARK